jgi:O-acetyl-ADP-ribose deacetylase (regulator of RNase III)
MKIIYKKGDVTEASEGVIVHGCNALGVMGSGVAKTIREKFPEAYKSYREEHENFGLKLGSVYDGGMTNGKRILNAITQGGYGTDKRQVNYESIYKCFETINIEAKAQKVTEIAMPRIGAGLGGGNWRIIETIIEETATSYQPVVYDYEG